MSAVLGSTCNHVRVMVAHRIEHAMGPRRREGGSTHNSLTVLPADDAPWTGPNVVSSSVYARTTRRRSFGKKRACARLCARIYACVLQLVVQGAGAEEPP